MTTRHSFADNTRMLRHIRRGGNVPRGANLPAQSLVWIAELRLNPRAPPAPVAQVHCRMARIFATLGLVLATALPAYAADPPKPLFGKSIVVAWTEARIQRPVGETTYRGVNGSHSLSVYVSSTGRVFNRFTNISQTGTRSNEQVAGSEGATRVPSFDGRNLSILMPFRSGGARKISVEFAAAFGSCKANVMYEAPPGTTHSIGFNAYTKRMIELRHIVPNEATCSIQDGNVFSGQEEEAR